MRHQALPEVLQRLEPSIASSAFRISDSEFVLALRLGEALCSRVGLPSTCLFRALSRWVLLRWQARPAQFVMGIDSTLGGDEAHAWVEVRGAAFLEQIRPGLIVVFRHPNDG